DEPETAGACLAEDAIELDESRLLPAVGTGAEEIVPARPFGGVRRAFPEGPDAPDGEPVGARGFERLGGAGAIGAVHDSEVGADEGEGLALNDEARAFDFHECAFGDQAGERHKPEHASIILTQSIAQLYESGQR